MKCLIRSVALTGLLLPFLYASGGYSNVAWATPPLSADTVELWKRKEGGEILLAEYVPDSITRLCLAIEGKAFEIPKEFLRDIPRPDVNSIDFWAGMGFPSYKKYVPRRGLWDLSLMINTFPEVAQEPGLAGSYHFLMTEEGVWFKVVMRAVPVSDQSTTLKLVDVWEEIGKLHSSGARCIPSHGQ